MNRFTPRACAAISAAAVGAAVLMAGPASSLALDLSTAAAPSTTPVEATVEGTNPHGQGTAVSVSVLGKEALVVNRSRGEQQSDGSYHGHNTTLAVLGNDVIANDTKPGQTAKSPLAPVQEQVLDPVCSGSGGNICAEALRSDSATTATGSSNHQRLAGLKLGGDKGLSVVAADSNGNIQQNGDCQTAHGDVTLLKLMLGGNPLLDLGESASDSNACPNGTTTHNSENPLLAIGGQAVPLPGCGANSPGALVDLNPLLVIACNAASQAGAGGTLNEALGLVGLVSNGTPTLAATLGGTGAAAQPPAAQPAAQGSVLGVHQSSPPAKASPARSRKARGHNTSTAGHGAPRAANATHPVTATAAGKLPYTGTDVVLALFIAAALVAGGLGIRRLPAVQRRA